MKRICAMLIMLMLIVGTASAEGSAQVSGPALLSRLPVAADVTELPKPENYEERMKELSSSSVSICCPASAEVNAEEGRIDFWYEQNWVSSHDVVLQIVKQEADGGETLLAESGLLQRGHRLNSMELLEPLEPGEYKTSLRLYFYDGTSEVAAMGSKLTLKLKVPEPEEEEGAELEGNETQV